VIRELDRIQGFIETAVVSSCHRPAASAACSWLWTDHPIAPGLFIDCGRHVGPLHADISCMFALETDASKSTCSRGRPIAGCIHPTGSSGRRVPAWHLRHRVKEVLLTTRRRPARLPRCVSALTLGTPDGERVI